MSIRAWDVPYAYGPIYAYGAEHGHEIFPEASYILLLKVDCFERFLNLCKSDGMVNDNSNSCVKDF